MRTSTSSVQLTESFLAPIKTLDRMAPPAATSPGSVTTCGTPAAGSQALPNVDIAAIIHSTRSIGRNRAACDVAVSTAFNAIFDRSLELSCLKPIAAFTRTWNPQEYKDGERTVEQFRCEMALIR